MLQMGSAETTTRTRPASDSTASLNCDAYALFVKKAFVLAAVGIALTAMIVMWNAGSKAVAPPSAESDLAPLVARLELLERRLAEARGSTERPLVETPVRREVAEAQDNSALVELAKRVEELEARLTALEPRKLSTEELRAFQIQIAKQRSQIVESAIAQARQANSTEEEKLASLRTLRDAKLADGTDARLAVLDEMILLAHTSTNASTREDVWRQLHHVTDQRLKGPLIDSLALDKDEKVRARAAYTLDDFMPDRQVEVALRNASDNDPSADVRKVAARSLAGNR